VVVVVVVAAVVVVISSSSDLSVALCYLKNYTPEAWAVFSIIVFIFASTT